MNQLVEASITIALAVIGLAMISVLVSKRANTTGVIQASGSAFGNALAVAQSPVTGNAVRVDLSYPGGGFGGFTPSFGF